MQLLHGSGKTAVLVERIIQKIIKDKIDVDKILVVTFTNAAASEMRERILEAIYKKIDENPQEVNLKKQILLLNRANISTIHAFCLEVIKNNFFEIDISPNFRIGDTAEIELLKQDTIEELFEELYDKQDNDFLELVDMYAGYRNDDELKDIVLKLYNYIQSTPFPYNWLHEKVECFNLDENQDFSETSWGRIILEEIKIKLEDAVCNLDYIYKKISVDAELIKYATIIKEDIEMYEQLLNSTKMWDITYKKMQQMEYSKWPVDKKINSELKEEAKQVRDNVKKQITEILSKTLIYSSKEANIDLKKMYKTLKNIEKLINTFGKKYTNKKNEINCIDFNDIEHYALQILIKEENGHYIPSDVAKKYQDKFEEIAIDEYQDSNLVQEYLLKTISRSDNIFMVGDVKQSIYKFRQARPELFLKKYEDYKTLDNKKEGENLKIKLFQNFRSRSNILDFTNLVFNTIMSKSLGEIEYNKDEYLQQDKDYDLPNDGINNFAGKAELHIINLETENIIEDDEHVENVEIEAKYVAKKIQNLLNSGYYIFDKKKKEYRLATYKDIVVLLRSTKTQAPVYEKELTAYGIPVFSDASMEYLDSIEIQTIISVLKVLDNPLQDIPLVSILRSYIGGFTDNELIKIRLLDKDSYFYNSLKTAKQIDDNKIKNKVNRLFVLLEKWKKQLEYLSLEEVIWSIYRDTGYYQYVSLMPDGNIRVANLKLLLERAKQYEKASFKGLFNFIHYIDKIKNSSGDLGAAKIIGENENVVRIMSIHKSKGLEFPIVFLCGTGKKFNLQDLNDKFLMHHDIGFGPKYIDQNRGIEYNTLAKEAIRIKAKKEAISEEMRVLYVALTRSREKLIITGIDKNYNESMEKKQILIEMYNGVKETLIEKFSSFLDWFEIIKIEKKSEIDKLLDTYIIQKSDVLCGNEKINIKEDFLEKFNQYNKKDDQIEKILKWRYSYELETKIQSKTSVTNIKESNTKTEQSNAAIPIPMFIKEKDQVTASQRGSIIHMVLQRLNLKKMYDKLQIQEEIKKMVVNKILTQKEAESIEISRIETFLKSNLAEQIRNATEIYQEIPFYMNISAREAFLEETDEKVLVQGIIDLYFINQNGEVILVDYKTDYVTNEKYLIDNYKEQLDLYKRAIQEATNKKVSKTYIYSMYLGKEIEI